MTIKTKQRQKKMPPSTDDTPPPQRQSPIPAIIISLFSYGRANGPLVLHPQPQSQSSSLVPPRTRNLAYSIRHLPNPPRGVRAMTTGLSPRLRREFVKADGMERFLEKIQGEIFGVVEEEIDVFSSFSESSREGQFDGSREKRTLADKEDNIYSDQVQEAKRMTAIEHTGVDKDLLTTGKSEGQHTQYEA